MVMPTSMRKRNGTLKMSPEVLTAKPTIYGNTHRGFGMRRPTPTSEGFFGIGSASAGDGKLHYFGDGPGQSGLPMHGFYGFGSAELEYQAANMLIDGAVSHNPTHDAVPGMYGVGDNIKSLLTDTTVGPIPNWMLLSVAAGYFYLR